MTTKLLTALLLGTSILGSAGVAYADDVTLNIESWRNDDLAIWQDKIIPAFEAKNPGIKVMFSPTAPTEYNAALNAKLDAGTAGDLITCRPFDASLELFKKGKLADLTDAARHGEFLRRSPRPPGRPTTARRRFCVPMASVIHGFIYNKDAFDKLGIKVPTTQRRVLRRARQDQGRRHLHPDGHGHQGPVGSRDHGLPEHRPELLEGRGRPPGADQRQAEADRRRLGRALSRSSPSGSPISATASRRRPIRTARTCSRSAAPPSTRPARGRSAVQHAGRSSRWAPSRRRSRRPATPATSPTTPISASASTPRRKNADAAKTFLTWVASAEFADHLRQRAAGLLQPELQRR